MTKELTYKQAGDYLIPDLTLDGAEELEEMPLGKYGMLRETFLEERHPGTYTSMLLTGRLYPPCRSCAACGHWPRPHQRRQWAAQHRAYCGLLPEGSHRFRCRLVYGKRVWRGRQGRYH